MAVGFASAQGYGTVSMDHLHGGVVVLKAYLTLIQARLHQKIGISLYGGLRSMLQHFAVHHVLGLNGDPESMRIIQRRLVNRSHL